MKKLFSIFLISSYLWGMEGGAYMEIETQTISDEQLALQLQEELYIQDMPIVDERSRKQSWTEWQRRHMLQVPQSMSAPQFPLRPSTSCNNNSDQTNFHEHVVNRLETIQEQAQSALFNQLSQADAQKILFQLAKGKTDIPEQTLTTMVSMVLAAGAQVSKVDETGKTVMQCAKKTRNKVLVRLLKQARQEDIQSCTEQAQKK